MISLLGAYGITSAYLTALQGAISAFSLLIGKPRTAKAVAKAAGDMMAIELKEASRILKGKIDKMMRQYTISAPKFFKAYTSCREIIDIGVRHEDNSDAPPPSA